jgi:hypothetical protein
MLKLVLYFIVSVIIALIAVFVATLSLMGIVPTWLSIAVSVVTTLGSIILIIKVVAGVLQIFNNNNIETKLSDFMFSESGTEMHIHKVGHGQKEIIIRRINHLLKKPVEYNPKTKTLYLIKK